MQNNSPETPTQPRPKNLIFDELEKVKKDAEKQIQDFEPFMAQMDTLPEPEKELLNSYGQNLFEGNVSDTQTNDLPTNLAPLIPEIKKYVMAVKASDDRQKALEIEVLPHMKLEFEEKLDNVSARINFDAVFDYYQEIDLGKRERNSNTDLLANTTTELFLLREYQYQSLGNLDTPVDFYYYLRAIAFLNNSQNLWNEKGFLLDSPKENYSRESGFQKLAETKSTQKETLENVEKAIEQLDEYGYLLNTYHFSYNSREAKDYSLEGLSFFLKQKYPKGSDYMYYKKGYENIGYDPEMVAAAKRFTDKVLATHKQEGHISRDATTLQEERMRIDSVDLTKTFESIAFDGFDTLPNEVLIITPDELRTLISKNIPPDFAKDLQRIGHKKEKPQGDNPDFETVGRFFPIYGEDDNWGTVVASEIEVYRDISIPAGTPDMAARYLKKDFLSTTWHEFGHNAHHRLDYDEMKGWETVIAEDKTAVTWYVKHAREDDKDRGKREDFSVSADLFLSSPALLSVLSLSRYQYMYEFFDKHLHKDQKIEFRKNLVNKMVDSRMLWQNMGYTEEYIKKIYLEHENN